MGYKDAMHTGKIQIQISELFSDSNVARKMVRLNKQLPFQWDPKHDLNQAQSMTLVVMYRRA